MMPGGFQVVPRLGGGLAVPAADDRHLLVLGERPGQLASVGGLDALTVSPCLIGVGAVGPGRNAGNAADQTVTESLGELASRQKSRPSTRSPALDVAGRIRWPPPYVRRRAAPG